MLEKLKSLFVRRWIEESATPEVESVYNVTDEIELKWVRVSEDSLSTTKVRALRFPVKMRITERYYPLLYMKRILWFTKIEKIEHDAILRVQCEGQLLADGRYVTIAVMFPLDFGEVSSSEIDQPVRLVIEVKRVFIENQVNMWDMLVRWGKSEDVKKMVIDELIAAVKKAIRDDIKKQVNIFKGWRLL